MEKFYGGGGRSNPDFIHKVRISDTTSAMIEWCDAYPVEGSGYFQRYYIHWAPSINGGGHSVATFQFEIAEAALLFKLTFGGK